MKHLKTFENIGNWTIQKLTDWSDSMRYLDKKLILYLNKKVGKTGKYPYSIDNYYEVDGVFVIVYTDNNENDELIGNLYYQVEKEDMDELIEILNEPDLT